VSITASLHNTGRVTAGTDWLDERALREGPTAFVELIDGSARADRLVLTPTA
jgi:hypothetical protein